MSLRAYQQVSAKADSPRQTEYRLFAEVTLALMEAAKLDRFDIRGRIDALDWNRRLWTVLGSDCAQASNELPVETRSGIVSLSIWVSRYTTDVIAGQEDIQDLIDVNRMIMQGLAG